MAAFTKIILGEGTLYFDYGETGEVTVGYVKGGEFNDGYVVRHIEVDGKKGNMKGDVVVEEVIPVLTVNMMEIISTEWEKAFAGIEVDATTPAETELTRLLVIADGDYLTNVAFVGATKEGKDCIVQVDTALGEGGIGLSFADKSEVEIPVTFVGNFLTLADTVAPYKIIIDES